MNREDIENAAYKDACLRHRLAGMAWFVSKTAFERGAEWSINSIWHDISEVPKKKGYILVQINELYPIYVVWSITSTDWYKTAERANAFKWAYIEDLLPIK